MQVRQGDIFISSSAIPATATRVERKSDPIILAEGEVTGHAHTIREPNVEVYTTAESTDRWLRVGTAGATVRHQEHGMIALPPGDFVVRRQREYRPAENIRVAD